MYNRNTTNINIVLMGFNSVLPNILFTIKTIQIKLHTYNDYKIT